jgi:hypothetical protein
VTGDTVTDGAAVGATVTGVLGTDVGDEAAVLAVDGLPDVAATTINSTGTSSAAPPATPDFHRSALLNARRSRMPRQPRRSRDASIFTSQQTATREPLEVQQHRTMWTTFVPLQ